MHIRTTSLAVMLAFAAAPAIAAPPASKMFTAGYVQANLVKGKTTREEVLELFGKPYEVDERVTSGYSSTVIERWTYNKRAQSARGRWGQMRSALSRVGDVIGSNEVSNAITDAQLASGRVENRIDAAGDLLNGPQSRENKSIVIEFENGVVTYFAFQ